MVQLSKVLHNSSFYILDERKKVKWFWDDISSSHDYLFNWLSTHLPTNLSITLLWIEVLAHIIPLMPLPLLFTSLFYSLQWSNENQSELVETAGSLFRTALSVLMPDRGSARQLPPSVAGIGPKSRVMFPLGMGHATEYIRHRVAIIGYVCKVEWNYSWFECLFGILSHMYI